jgi:hypothetical protein
MSRSPVRLWEAAPESNMSSFLKRYLDGILRNYKTGKYLYVAYDITVGLLKGVTLLGGTIVLIVSFLNWMQNPTKTSLATSQVVNGGAPCSVTTIGQSGGTNIPCGNQIATYGWANEKTWKVEDMDPLEVKAHDGKIGLFFINFRFISKGGQILPKRVCFILSSNKPVININTSGVTYNNDWVESLKNTDNTFFSNRYCFDNPTSDQFISASFDTPPNIIATSLENS